MKYIVDTCGWIEWLTSGKLIKKFAPYLTTPDELFVPTIIQYELYKWICRERDEATALNIIGITEQSYVVPLDSALALEAADTARQFHLAMADAIIYTTARSANVMLVTCDNHFEHLPNVKYFPKN